jgi:hypothetical protein
MFMKYSLKSAPLLLSLLTVALFPSPPLVSQTAQPATPPHRVQSIYRTRTLDDRVKDLAKTLDFSENQQAGLKTVLERQQLQARQIQFDQTLSGNERIGEFRALLNDQQKKKYAPLNHGTQPAGSSQPYIDQ